MLHTWCQTGGMICVWSVCALSRVSWSCCALSVQGRCVFAPKPATIHRKNTDIRAFVCKSIRSKTNAPFSGQSSWAGERPPGLTPHTLKIKGMMLLCDEPKSKRRVTSSTCQQGLGVMWVAVEAAGSLSVDWQQLWRNRFRVWGWEPDEPLGGGGCAWVGGCGRLKRECV